MKKRFLLVPLALICAVLFTFVLVACDNGVDNAGDNPDELRMLWEWSEDFSSAEAVFYYGNNGKKTRVTATVTNIITPATCLAFGQIAYTATANFNGKDYSENKTKIIPPLGHDYGEPEWTWNGYESATAKFTCANDSSHNKTVTAKIKSFNTATCTESGYITYTATATLDGKNYINKKREIEPVPALGHNYGEPEFVWDKDYASATAVFFCTNGNHIKTVKATVVADNRIEPTCTEKGNALYTAFVTFEDKNYSDIKTKTLEATGHNSFNEQNVCEVCGSPRTLGLAYELSSDGTYYTVTGIGKATDKDIYIPAVYNKKAVISIGNNAFKNCSALSSISIPDSVTNVGNYTFYGCSGLTSVTIGNNVSAIETCTFYGCSGLKRITIPDNATSIRDNAFKRCTGLSNIIIGKNVSAIGNNAFEGCTGLTSITIPNNVMSIGDNVFKGCIGLTNVKIGNNVLTIKNNVFEGCTGLTSITIPDSVMSIGDNAFNGCTALTSVTIGKNVSAIGNCAFESCSDLTNITIPDSVTSIGYYAFRDCTDLTELSIPDSVTSIGLSAFNGCTGLTSITIPFIGLKKDNAAYAHLGFLFGADSYHYNSQYVPISLKQVTLTGGTRIEKYAFYGCTGINSINLPNSVTSIDECAFYKCTGLTNLTFADTTTWYKTDNYNNYINKTGGTKIDVTNSSDNVTYFTDTYYNYYWYKR